MFDNINASTIITLSVTISIAVFNVFFGLHGRLKKLPIEKIGTLKEILAITKDEPDMSDIRHVAKHEMKSQLLFEFSGLKSITHAMVFVEIMRHNPELSRKKKTSIRSVIDCIEQKNVSSQSSYSSRYFSLNKKLYAKKKMKGLWEVFKYVALAILFSQLAFLLFPSGPYKILSFLSGVWSLVMLYKYARALIDYPVIDTYRNLSGIISGLNLSNTK